LYTKKGVYRSGDIHPNVQYDCIVKGSITVKFRQCDKDIEETYCAPIVITIPKNTPHLFYFRENTIMIEWWSGKFKAKYYKPYRDIVEANKSAQ